MQKAGLGIGAFGVVTAAILVLASNLGLIGIAWPWEKIGIPDVLTDETMLTQPEEAEIFEIEAIALDCRARIHASVPVVGKREHKALGQVYRTDTVEMHAIGDIDTCVDSTSVEVQELADGRFQVLVPADSITFERPRVDAAATAGSVDFDKGFVGKITDAFPWVSDDSGLTPAAYTFAQDVVGSSECMEQAWDITEQVLRDAYRDQLIAQGGDPEKISVIMSGVPNFGEPPENIIEDYSFEVSGDTVACTVDPQAYEADLISDPDA